jgi:16S rRNA (adenine1518-N6/adenine1519-N6)-dimethyltransferase
MSATFDLKAKLTEMGLAPKKAFGQNFLVSEHVIRKIIDCVYSYKFDDLLEVGPGLGALTDPLLKLGHRPRLIELDRELVEHWRTRGMDVTDADAIKLNWNDLHLKAPALLVSNLPYQISTHLVIDRCFGPQEIKYMVLMFQKEVAQRLTAEPRTKDYGLLSVMAQLHFRMRKVTDASPGDFFPPPKIASRVLGFERIDGVVLGERFLGFIKAAFAFRRKFLLKNIKGVVDKSKHAQLPSMLKEMGLSEKARAEELTPAQFVELFHKVLK